jgi:hypothetical protein
VLLSLKMCEAASGGMAVPRIRVVRRLLVNLVFVVKANNCELAAR